MLPFGVKNLQIQYGWASKDLSLALSDIGPLMPTCQCVCVHESQEGLNHSLPGFGLRIAQSKFNRQSSLAYSLARAISTLAHLVYCCCRKGHKWHGERPDTPCILYNIALCYVSLQAVSQSNAVWTPYLPLPFCSYSQGKRVRWNGE